MGTVVMRDQKSDMGLYDLLAHVLARTTPSPALRSFSTPLLRKSGVVTNYLQPVHNFIILRCKPVKGFPLPSYVGQ